MPRDPSIDRWGFPIRSISPSPPKKRLSRPKGKQTDRWGKRLPSGISTQRTERVIGPGSRFQTQFIAGLRKLCLSRQPGQVFSQREIARKCGSSAMYVKLIERGALRKMRALLPPEVRATFDEIMARGRVAGRINPAKNGEQIP